MKEHTNWYEQLVGDATERSVALKSGIITSTLNRQLKAGTLSAENVILIARAYKENPIAALATTGYITAEEATRNIGEIAQLLPDRQLIAELARRIGVTPEELMSVDNQGLGATPNIENDNNVAHINEPPHIDEAPQFIEYDPDTMVAYEEKEIIPPDDQFDA